MKSANYINSKAKPINKHEYDACADVILAANKDNINNRDKLIKLINKSCEKYQVKYITNAKLLYLYNQLISTKKIEPNNNLFELLRKRKIRTSSGIASLAVLTKPYKCPGNCLFCPTQEDVPKSYLSNEPAVMRAILADYDPVSQIFIRLRGLELSGNPADKLELIVMGGTWSYLPIKYQLRYLIGCFWACNNYDNVKYPISNFQSNLERQIPNIKKINIDNYMIEQLWERLKKEQRTNETAKYRIVGLTLETRPDYINEREIIRMRKMGCTRVELGVQSVYDDVLKNNNRGHNVKTITDATKKLKYAGLKINYHMMPGLYGSNLVKDYQMFYILFHDERFQPDMLKIYPCVVTKNSELYKKYKSGEYIPYTNVQLIQLIKRIKKIIPSYARIQRLIRDIPAESIMGGSKISNLRQLVKNQVKCQCIRCREIRNDKKMLVKLERIDYFASDGKEIFLQFVDKNYRLYALLRLRINYKNKIFNRMDYNYPAIIREVHTYGPMLAVGQDSIKNPQHSGMGKKLIKEAEKITKNEFNIKKIAVISGVGVRNYYKKLGYRLKNTYMIKKLNS